MSNVYAAPGAALSTQEKTADTRFWSLNDRLGRLRYLVYLLGTNFIAGFPVMALGVYVSRQSVLAAIYMPIILPPLQFGLSIGYGCWFARRRLRDMNASGAWALLCLIPFVHFLVDFVLLFPRGSRGTNRYGPPPSPNSLAIRVLAWVLPLLLLLTLIAAGLIHMGDPIRRDDGSAPASPLIAR